MLYAVGVYHPRPGAYNLPGNYSLTHAQLASINVINVPLTIEHRGIFDAVGRLGERNQSITAESVGAELDKLAATDALKAPVGVVIEGRESQVDGKWYCLLAIDVNQFNVIPFLIKTNALAGLSLTHLTGSTLTGTEISLCFKPARPECYINTTFAALPTAMQYMRDRCNPTVPTPSTPTFPTVPTIMAASAAAAATMVAANDIGVPTPTTTNLVEPKRLETWDDAVNAMDDRVREIVAATFTSMVKKVEAAKKRADAAESSSNVLKINTDLLKSQIEQMSTNMTPEVQRVYSCSAEQLNKDFGSNSADVLKNAAQRMLMACNHQLMMANAKSLGTVADDINSPRKRKAVDGINTYAPTPVTITAASAGAAAAAAATTATPHPSAAATSDPTQELNDAVARFAEFEML
jgi:hypothetical protein